MRMSSERIGYSDTTDVEIMPYGPADAGPVINVLEEIINSFVPS